MSNAKCVLIAPELARICKTRSSRNNGQFITCNYEYFCDLKIDIQYIIGFVKSICYFMSECSSCAILDFTPLKPVFVRI